MRKELNAYNKNKIRAASPVEQVSIILSQAARLMNKASLAIEDKNFEEQSLHIEKAMKLMNGLRGTLDRDNTEDEAQTVVEVMSSFYQQMSAFMMKAGVNCDVNLCRAIEKNLQEMSTLWRNAAAQPLPIVPNSVSNSTTLEA